VADPEFVTGGREDPAAITAAVVGQDPLDRDAVAGIEPPGPLQEARGGCRVLVGQLLGIGETGMVVDRKMDPVPGIRWPPPGPIRPSIFVSR
jgi:hypothetical protein